MIKTNNLRITHVLTLILLFSTLIITSLPVANAADLTAADETELAAAIDAANSAGAGEHTITLTADITLTAPLPAIDNADATSILLDGAGHTLDAANSGTALAIRAGTTATIQAITVTGGAGSNGPGGLSGGGIYNEGTLSVINSTIAGNSAENGAGIVNYAGNSATANLTLTGVTVSDNSASDFGGGIYSNGAGGAANLTITDSTIAANEAANFGGGIANHGFGGNAAVTIQNSTIDDNDGEYGAGIFNNGNAGEATVTLIGVTMSNNDATNSGGAIFNNGNLGTASISITNSTLSNNTAVVQGGGIANTPNSGTSEITLRYTTVAFNSANKGAGLLNSSNGIFQIGASILASDSANDTCAISGEAVFTSEGYNLDDDDSCGLNAAGDIPGGDHALEPLATNAPGTTATHAIDVNSAAHRQIPTGTLGCGDTIVTDQRGAPRPLPGVLCDIGAFESATPEDVTPPDCAPPYVPATEEELHNAILCVNAAGEGNHLITLAANISLTAATPALDNTNATEILLDGAGYMLDGGLTGTVLSIGTGTTVRIKDVRITGGQGSSGPTDDWGGGIYNRGELTVETSIFSGNTAARGGAIANHADGAGASLTVVRSTLSGNSAAEEGGAILNTAGVSGTATLALVNSTLSGNTADMGGGLFNEASGGDAGANLVYATLAGNSAANGGGGIHLVADGATSSVTMAATIIYNGSAAGPDCALQGGVLTSTGYNLAGDDSCKLTQGNDLPNTNPELLPLALNAPGLTPTHALGSSSPAIDQIHAGAAGCGSVVVVDQRGVDRPQPAGGMCDMGAFEASPHTPAPVFIYLPGILR